MREAKGLSDDARMVLLYLWTSPHANMVWFYHCPLAYMLEDLGWAEETRLQRALDELSGRRLAYYDHTNQVAFVALALADRPPAGSKQIEGAVAATLAVIATPLLATLAEIAAAACPSLAVALGYPMDTVSIGYLAPANIPSIGSHAVPDSDTVSDSDSKSLVGDEGSSPTEGSILPQEGGRKLLRHYPPESVEYQLAARLRAGIRSNFPGAAVPAEDALDRWADTIRLLMADPKRELKPTPEEIAAIIDWSQANDFWRDNIRSTEKLRKHYDTLAGKADKARTTAAKPRGPIRRPTHIMDEPAWAKEAREAGGASS